MSANIVNNDLSLTRVAGNSNATVSAAGATFGKVDVIFEGTKTGTGELSCTKSFDNYDYIEIEFGTSKWLAFNSARYSVRNVNNSSSSSKLRFYINNSTSFSFYKYSSTSIYFANNNAVIRRVIGYKMGVTKAIIDNPKQGNNYSTVTTLTGGTWIDGKPIYRTVTEHKLTSSISSSTTNFTIPLNFSFKSIVDFKGFIVLTSGLTYTLPYIDGSGKSVSVYLYSPDNIFKIINKGKSFDAGTVFRLIVDYTV